MKKVLCSAEKSSVIWAKPHTRSLAEQFGQTEHSVGHYFLHSTPTGKEINYILLFDFRNFSLKFLDARLLVTGH